jgi:hypothetical protein
MMSPAWLLDILAALMLVVAAVSATRLATARSPANRLSAAEPTGSRSSPRGSGGADTDIAHLLMCIAMAGMLAPSVKTLPPHAWEAIFGLLTAWFAWRFVGDTRPAPFRIRQGRQDIGVWRHILRLGFLFRHGKNPPRYHRQMNRQSAGQPIDSYAIAPCFQACLDGLHPVPKTPS